MLFDCISAVIYGIVEGITEWLPISSTGHLILLEELLPFPLSSSLGEELAAEYRSMFDVVIQLGAILAVLCIYFNRLNPFTPQRDSCRGALSLWGKLIIATLPAALLGLAFDMLCEHYLGISLDSLLFKPQIVASALIVYGILFILTERLTAYRAASDRDFVSTRSALAIGFFQALAIIPGTSRSGATVLGARILGISRPAAAEFSFFAALPVIGAASLLKLIDFGGYVASSGAVLPVSALLMLCLAGLVAFGVSILTIKLLTDFVKNHSFVFFGVYRIILGILVLLFFK